MPHPKEATPWTELRDGSPAPQTHPRHTPPPSLRERPRTLCDEAGPGPGAAWPSPHAPLSARAIEANADPPLRTTTTRHLSQATACFPKHFRNCLPPGARQPLPLSTASLALSFFLRACEPPKCRNHVPALYMTPAAPSAHRTQTWPMPGKRVSMRPANANGRIPRDAHEDR